MMLMPVVHDVFTGCLVLRGVPKVETSPRVLNINHCNLQSWVVKRFNRQLVTCLNNQLVDRMPMQSRKATSITHKITSSHECYALLL